MSRGAPSEKVHRYSVLGISNETAVIRTILPRFYCFL